LNADISVSVCKRQISLNKARDTMKAYFIMEVLSISDEAVFSEYRTASAPLVAKWGGKMIARAAPVRVLEGEWSRTAITEFPSWEAAESFYDSEEYQELKNNRMKGAQCRLLLIGGTE
jgi:uncharacterized protein (DUF1330 family)